MKIYFAGNPGIRERERNWQRIVSDRLLSFWAISQKAFAIHYAFKLIIKRKRK